MSQETRITKLDTKTLARGSATRTANKIRRKERILSCARDIISTEGFDALTLSKLAAQAGVTIPTIHNLLGRKSQIIEHLVGDVIEQIEQVIASQRVENPINTIHLFTDKLISLYSKDEALYKAAFLAGERLSLFEHNSPKGIFMRSLALAVQLCENAKREGLLEGNIETQILADQIFGSQRLARHDWMNNYITLKDYKHRVLTRMFTILCADAAPEFKARLLAELKALPS